jgi:hypothetical protein
MAGAKEMIAQLQAGQAPAGAGGLVNLLRRMMEGRPVEPGTYLVKLTVGGKTFTTKAVVERDRLN